MNHNQPRRRAQAKTKLPARQSIEWSFWTLMGVNVALAMAGVFLLVWFFF
jgi:hypothetical protein